MAIDFNKFPTPCYIVDENLIKRNLEILKNVQDKTGCKILLAQKGFSMYSTYSLIRKYLKGTTASSLFEAKLGKEEMGGEVHIYSPAYKEEEIDEIATICDHIVFNSFEQLNKYKDRIKSIKDSIEFGIRINPEYSEVETEIYNPCKKNSRFGIKRDAIKNDWLNDVDGLHFHTMCEQNSDTLERTIKVVEEKFSDLFPYIKWINFGGGHHITRADYDVNKLISIINYIKEKYHLEVYLEPGEAIALNTGYLVSKVLEIIRNDIDIAILDTSAACHMPDVLEMPYRPEVIGAKKPNELQYSYRFAGPSCLAGDVIGDYSFEKPLKVGNRVVFTDMAHYTMVKNNTFNGINLPSIALYTIEDDIKLIKQFGYKNFKSRL